MAAQIIPFPAARDVDYEQPKSGLDAPPLPQRSGFIAPTLFRHYALLLLRYGLNTCHVGDIELIVGGDRFLMDNARRAPREIEKVYEIRVISKATGIKRCYFFGGDSVYAHWWTWITEEDKSSRKNLSTSQKRDWLVSKDAEAAALFNLRKLLAGKFAPAFEREAADEIEQQLSFVSTDRDKHYHRTKEYPEKVVFSRFREWKQAQGGH